MPTDDEGCPTDSNDAAASDGLRALVAELEAESGPADPAEVAAEVASIRTELGL